MNFEGDFILMILCKMIFLMINFDNYIFFKYKELILYFFNRNKLK